MARLAGEAGGRCARASGYEAHDCPAHRGCALRLALLELFAEVVALRPSELEPKLQLPQRRLIELPPCAAHEVGREVGHGH